MSSEITYPLVTVIIPTYNRADLIMETIESVRAQIYNNWEMIIVDDGSTDSTDERVSKLGDPRIQFVKAGRIGIGGRIKNIGIKKSKGELIAFIDSDDLWDPSKLQKQVDALERHPDAGFCLTGGYIFSIKSHPSYYFYTKQEGEWVDNLYPAIFKNEVTAYTQALMFKKSCLKKSGLFKEEKSFSDLEFIISLAENFAGIILYEPLLHRRLHPSNYINDTWEKSCREGVDIIKDNKKKLPKSIASMALFRAYIQWGEKYSLHKQRRKAVQCYIKAFLQRPFSIVPLKKTIKTLLKH